MSLWFVHQQHVTRPAKIQVSHACKVRIVGDESQGDLGCGGYPPSCPVAQALNVTNVAVTE